MRASMKKRTIALTAATSRPLPLTSPTSTASAAAGQPPDAEDVAAGDLLAGRLVDEPEREALELAAARRG